MGIIKHWNRGTDRLCKLHPGNIQLKAWSHLIKLDLFSAGDRNKSSLGNPFKPNSSVTLVVQQLVLKTKVQGASRPWTHTVKFHQLNRD